MRPRPSTDDDRVTDDRRRGGGIVEARPDLAHVARQVDDARLAEALAHRSRSGVELDQPRIDRGQHDARPAGRVRGLRHCVGAGDIMRHAAAALPERRARFGIEPPDQRARLGIDGRDDVVRRAMVHEAVDMERRVLVLPAARRRIAMIETPGDLELADIGGRDPVERRVARAAGRAAVMGPVGAGRHRLGRGAQRRGRGPVMAHDVLGREHAVEKADHANGQRHGDSCGGSPPASAGERRGQQGRRDRQHHRGDETRHERPEIEPCFPESPEQRAGEDQGEGHCAERTPAKIPKPGQHKPGARESVVPRASERHEVDARQGQQQPCQTGQKPENPESPARRRRYGGIHAGILRL